mmetsp:Transcript_7132/g.12353  ORF Transcript_7132/g.12353 Transcript_7132/m.12353 type:complete len:146 (-) Transcript_7132:571-1008(-)
MAPKLSVTKKIGKPTTDHQASKRKGKAAAVAVAEEAVKEHDKRKSTGAAGPSGKKAKKGSAIDDIFASTKTVKAATAVEEEAKKKEEEEIAKLVSEHPPEFEKLGKGGRTQTSDPDALFIYSDKEMKIGLGKDTKDCPFDCWCCY